MRSKAEVRVFFESRVGTVVRTKPSSDLDGQCVTLEKALLEFLGIPNPYKARGNAKDYANALIREGIATNGAGWLNVVVNRDMGVRLNDGTLSGHIWNDLQGEANYEQNGARALVVTKGTRPISQARQIVNLDKWLKESNMAKIENAANWRWRFNRLHHQLVGNWDMSDEVFNSIVGQDAWKVVESWSDHPNSNATLNYQWVGETAVRDKWDKQIFALQEQVKNLSSRPTEAEIESVRSQVDNLNKNLEDSRKRIEDLREVEKELDELKKNQLEDSILLNEAGSWLTKLWNRLFKKG